jgi:hypothetical protein
MVVLVFSSMISSLSSIFLLGLTFSDMTLLPVPHLYLSNNNFMLLNKQGINLIKTKVLAIFS